MVMRSRAPPDTPEARIVRTYVRTWTSAPTTTHTQLFTARGAVAISEGGDASAPGARECRTPKGKETTVEVTLRSGEVLKPHIVQDLGDGWLAVQTVAESVGEIAVIAVMER